MVHDFFSKANMILFCHQLQLLYYFLIKSLCNLILTLVIVKKSKLETFNLPNCVELHVEVFVIITTNLEP